jgi:hypothetical protein
MNSLLPQVQRHTTDLWHSQPSWFKMATKHLEDIATPSTHLNPLCDDVTCLCHDDTSNRKSWTFVPIPTDRCISDFFGASSVVTAHDRETLVDLPDRSNTNVSSATTLSSSAIVVPETWLQPHNLILATVTKMTKNLCTELAIEEIRMFTHNVETSDGRKMRSWDPKSICLSDFIDSNAKVLIQCNCILSNSSSSSTSSNNGYSAPL